MRSKGKITSWNDDKAYGFITPVVGEKQIFVHINAFPNRARRPKTNDVVTYSLSKDKQGRPCAVDATLAGDKLKEKAPRKSKRSSILFALLFLGAVGVSFAIGRLPLVVLIGYVALSLVTFFAYALDKSAAKSGSQRTSEGTLILFGLIGGWPGALIAQQSLRHKSKKASFRVVLWASILLNCAVLVWIHTAGGRASLDSLF